MGVFTLIKKSLLVVTLLIGGLLTPFSANAQFLRLIGSTVPSACQPTQTFATSTTFYVCVNGVPSAASGLGVGTLTGTGTSGTLPIWTGATALGNSVITYSSPTFSFAADKTITLNATASGTITLGNVSGALSLGSNGGTVTTTIGGGDIVLGQNGVKSGNIQFNGQTSGSAIIGVANAAGNPARINWPTATGTANYFLMTDGGTPQQTSWSAISSSSCPTCVFSSPAGALDPTIKGGILGVALGSGGSTSTTLLPGGTNGFRSGRDLLFGVPTFNTTTTNTGGSKWQWLVAQPPADTASQNVRPAPGQGIAVQSASAAAGVFSNANYYQYVPKYSIPFVQQSASATGSSANVLTTVVAHFGWRGSFIQAPLNTTMTTGLTRYFNQGWTSFTATEANAEMACASDANIGNIRFALNSANSSGGTVVVNLRVNGATAGTLLTLSASAAAGIYDAKELNGGSDVVFACTRGQRFTFQVINNGSGSTGTILYIQAEVIPTETGVNGWIPFPNTSGSSMNTANNNYFWPFTGQSIDATESTHRFAPGRAFNVKYICGMSSVAAANNGTVSVVVHGTPHASTLTYGTGGSSQCSSSVTIPVTIADDFDVNFASGATVPTNFSVMLAIE